MRLILLLILPFLVISCAPTGEKLAALRAKNPTGDTFPTALAKEYLAYADSLAERGHPLRADRFAAKGLAASQGEEVAPEKKDSLKAARNSLLTVLTPDVKEVAPDKAARAQLLFDCWVDETGRLGDKDAICKDGFESALSDVQFIADTLVHGSDNRFVVKFTSGSMSLSDEARTVLSIVAKRLQGLGEYKVELMSYAKRPRASSKVKLLANQRMLAIEKALIEKGVNAGKIHSHPVAKDSEVFLAVDQVGGDQNAVGISIQTFGQVDEAKTP